MKKNWLFLALFLIVALSRLVPHPWNFSPVGALALFAGFIWTDRKWVVWAPMAVVLFTDVFIGLHPTMPFVYLAYIIIALLGRRLQKPTWMRVGLGAVLASVLFFLLTNFGVWAITDIYPKTTSGLLECYIAGVPFFHNTFISNVIFAYVLAVGYNLIGLSEQTQVLTANQS